MASEDKIELYKRIVDAYFLNGFDHRAAVREVRGDEDMNNSTADSYWYRLRENEQIRQYVADKHFEAREELKISHQEMLKTLKAWVDSDFTKAMCLTEKQVKEELPLELRKLIKGFKKSETEFEGGTKTVFEIFWMDKGKAIDLICKHIGFFEKDQNEAVEIVITDNRKP